MTRNYASLGLKLLAQGFEPIPVEGKVPAVEGWENLELTEARVKYWAENGQGALNIGIRSDHLAPINIQVLDAEVSALVAEEFQKKFGKAPLRIGMRPNRMLLYRTEKPGPEISSVVFKTADHMEHQVEMLGTGQQVVVYGKHPDSNRQYVWPDGELADMKFADLPVIDRDEVAAWLKRGLRDILLRQGFIPQDGALPAATTPVVRTNPPRPTVAPAAAPGAGPSVATPNYASLGLKLLRQGFEPIPVKGKAPVVTGWQKIDLTETRVKYWAENGKGSLNVGIRCANLVPVDIDIYDAEVSALVAEEFQKKFGPAPLRIGMRPKRLLLYRAVKPGPKITSVVYKTADYMEHRVEVLGIGQQFVAYGPHPDSNRPYEWFNGELADTELWELPIIDRDEVAAWVKDDLAELLMRHGFIPQYSGSTTGANPTTGATFDADDPFDVVKPRHDDMDIAGLKWLLEQLPIERCDNRDEWRNAIFAAHHQFRGTEEELDALEAIDEWSAKSAKYVAGEVAKIWEDAHQQRGGLVTAGTLKSWVGLEAWKTYQASRLAETVKSQDWEGQLTRAADVAELEKIAAQVRATPGLSEGTIASLAGKAVARCRVLKIAMTAAQWKKQMTPRAKENFPVAVDLADFIPFNLAEPALNPTVFPHLEYTDKGIQVRDTIANVRRLMDAYGITAYYDGIKKKPIVNVPGVSSCSDQADNVALARIESLGNLNGMKGEKSARFAASIAYQDERSPIADWIKSKPWDGQDRIGPICETLTVREDYPLDLRNLLVRRWLISAAAAALKPTGFYSKGVLTLQGPQSIGKTQWVANLLPPGLLSDYVLLGAHLDPSNRDSIKNAVSHWLVELGEVDSTLNRSEMGALKAFISQRTDKLRLPYAPAGSEFQRRTVFAASVNHGQFLRDETGNVRWWTIPVTAINSNHGIDLQQMWAQVAVALDVGEQWWLTPEEEAQLEGRNADHIVQSSIYERLSDTIDLNVPKVERVRMTATKALQTLLQIKDPTNAQAKEAGAALRAILGEPKRSHGITSWLVPLAGLERNVGSTFDD